MKSKELIKIFELGSQILSHYKDKDIVYALTDILEKCDKSIKVSTSKKVVTEKRPFKSTNDAFLKEIDSMSLQDIQSKLNDKAEFPNIESLRELAIKFGLGKQLRANRDNIIHSILKMIERSRINQTISERHEA